MASEAYAMAQFAVFISGEAACHQFIRIACEAMNDCISMGSHSAAITPSSAINSLDVNLTALELLCSSARLAAVVALVLVEPSPG